MQFLPILKNIIAGTLTFYEPIKNMVQKSKEKIQNENESLNWTKFVTQIISLIAICITLLALILQKVDINTFEYILSLITHISQN
jgi:hypothetical protein